MTKAEELAAAEAFLDRLLTEEPDAVNLVALAYEREVRLREAEDFAWQRKQRRLFAYSGSRIVRAWQLPLVYAWRDLPVRGPRRCQHSGQCFCKNGHDLSIYGAPRPDGTGRNCRECDRQRHIAKRKRVLQAV